MLYIKISDENKTIIDKLFCLVNGIILAIEKKRKVVVFEDSTNMLINILDIDLMNKYLKNKFDIIITDTNYEYSLDYIKYGAENFTFDLTEEIKTSFIFIKDDRLLILKNISLNTIKGDPLFNIVKNLYIKYYINKISIIDIYEENRNCDIDINNKNPEYIKTDKNVNMNQDIFNNIIVNIQFKNIFQEKINIFDTEIKEINKNINVISLIPEEELNLSTYKDKDKEDIYNKYIYLIKKYIDIGDFNIILSDSVTNTVIDFLTNNNYNYIIIENFFEEKEKNEIINLLSTRYSNKIYIGSYDHNNPSNYNFSYYATKLFDKEVLKICIDPKKINTHNDEIIF